MRYTRTYRYDDIVPIDNMTFTRVMFDDCVLMGTGRNATFEWCDFKGRALDKIAAILNGSEDVGLRIKPSAEHRT